MLQGRVFRPGLLFWRAIFSSLVASGFSRKAGWRVSSVDSSFARFRNKDVMAETSKAIREFFDAYATAIKSLDLGFFRSAYCETFMFAGPGGVQVVKRDDFLRVLPKRGAFFRAAGLVASEVLTLEETRLDEQHTMVRVRWNMRFEKDPGRPITDESAATYVLRRQEDSEQIVFQLDHQDLAKRVQELGLLAASG